jgi:hypothetical protein
VLFGIILIGLTVYLLRGATRVQATVVPLPSISPRTLRTGAVLSVFIGFLSSVLGIGGGVMHVPMMARLLRFPFSTAAGTSQSVLAFMSLCGTLTHILAGEFQTGWRRTGALSLGVLVGAQIGARLSTRIGGSTLTRLLSAALLIIGLRLILNAVI